ALPISQCTPEYRPARLDPRICGRGVSRPESTLRLQQFPYWTHVSNFEQTALPGRVMFHAIREVSNMGLFWVWVIVGIIVGYLARSEEHEGSGAIPGASVCWLTVAFVGGAIL